jgi:hypothetical protein
MCADVANVSSGSASSVAATWVDRRFFPSAEDMRMVRAIACSALLEAASAGEYKASFRRFHVHAKRETLAGKGGGRIHVSITIGYDPAGSDGLEEQTASPLG